MTSLPWFRMYAEFAADPVVQSLAFEDQRHYVVLLCLKCNGTLDRPMQPAVRERIVCRGLGLDSSTADEVKRRLSEVALIDAQTWQPLGWDKRQYKSDVSTNRVRKSRKNKETGNVSETSRRRFRNAPDTDTEQSKTTPNGVVGKRATKRKLPDDFSLTAVRRAYLEEVAPSCDAAEEFDQFLDHHRAKGNTMADWDAAWRTWARNAQKFRGQANGQRSQGGTQGARKPSLVERVRAANGLDEEGGQVLGPDDRNLRVSVDERSRGSGERFVVDGDFKVVG